jgi:hypothetical protein
VYRNLTKSDLFAFQSSGRRKHTHINKYIYNYRAYRYDSKSVVNIIPYLEGMNIHKSQLLYYSPGDYMGGAHTALGNGQDHQTLSSQRLKKGQTKLPSY